MSGSQALVVSEAELEQAFPRRPTPAEVWAARQTHVVDGFRVPLDVRRAHMHTPSSLKEHEAEERAAFEKRLTTPSRLPPSKIQDVIERLHPEPKNLLQEWAVVAADGTPRRGKPELEWLFIGEGGKVQGPLPRSAMAGLLMQEQISLETLVCPKTQMEHDSIATFSRLGRRKFHKVLWWFDETSSTPGSRDPLDGYPFASMAPVESLVMPMSDFKRSPVSASGLTQAKNRKTKAQVDAMVVKKTLLEHQLAAATAKERAHRLAIEKRAAKDQERKLWIAHREQEKNMELLRKRHETAELKLAYAKSVQERHTAEQAKLARISSFWEKEGGGGGGKWSAGAKPSGGESRPYSPPPAGTGHVWTQVKWSQADLTDNWTRVEVTIKGGKKLLGWLRYVGELQTARSKLGTFLGVELDERVGKHNGTLNGKTYFKCQKMHGIFVRPSACRKMDDTSGSFESRRRALRKPRVQAKLITGVARAVKRVSISLTPGSSQATPIKRAAIKARAAADAKAARDAGPGAAEDTVEYVEEEVVEYVEELVDEDDADEQSTVHILVAGAAYVDTNVACAVLSEEFNVVALDLVSVLAAAGEDEPDLVSDERTAEIVAARVEEADCVENGFVLVGFPLTKEQAMVLDQKNVHFDVFIHLDLEDDEVKARGRAAGGDAEEIAEALEGSVEARSKLSEYFNAVAHQIDATLDEAELRESVIAAARATLEKIDIVMAATMDECVEIRSAVRDVFDAIDADSDGVVTIEELSAPGAVAQLEAAGVTGAPTPNDETDAHAPAPHAIRAGEGGQTLFDEWDADADGSLSFLEFEGGVNLFISTTTQPLPGDVEETRSTRAMVQAVFDRLAVGGLIAIETVVEQRASIEEEGLIMPDHIDELLVTYDEDADLCLTAQEFEACVNLYQ